jgi:predicted SAM-dependent methyltransferase
MPPTHPTSSAPTDLAPPAGQPLRLHVGAGRERLAGWINIDIQALPGVDVVADVTRGLRFSGAEAIFAEHFLEHLRLDDALRFLCECHRALAPGAWLRLSTPNLEWVWQTHYRLDLPAAEKSRAALRLNRAFHGWRHRFLWNREMLAEALAGCGFTGVRWCRYGESELPLFQGIERHEHYADSASLPHVLIAEASRGDLDPERFERLRALAERELLIHLDD